MYLKMYFELIYYVLLWRRLFILFIACFKFVMFIQQLIIIICCIRTRMFIAQLLEMKEIVDHQYQQLLLRYKLTKTSVKQTYNLLLDLLFFLFACIIHRGLVVTLFVCYWGKTCTAKKEATEVEAATIVGSTVRIQIRN